MPTDAQLKQEYEKYLTGDTRPMPESASDRVEQRIRNTAKSKQPVETAQPSVDAVKSEKPAVNDEQLKQEYEAYLKGVDEPVTEEDKIVEPVSDKPVDYEFSQTVENFPESLAQAGSDIAQMFMNPIDTATALGKVALGGIQRGTEDYRMPGEEYPSLLPNYTPEADAMGQAMMDRYGGLDQIKTTAMQDPVGMGLDLLGGAALVPGKLGRMAARIDPTDLPFKAAGSMLDPVGMYKSAAKFPSRFDADAVTKTALDNRIPPTESGLIKAGKGIESLGDDIASMIDQSVAKGELINVENILKPVNELRDKADTFKLSAADDTAKIDKIVQSFNDHIKKKGYDKVTATEVQKFKRDVYDSINWSKSKSTGSKATADARKAFARGAKEELEKIIPEVKGLNFKQGELIELADALQQPAARISRRDMGGIGVPIKAGAGNMLGEAVGGLLGEPAIGQGIGSALGAGWGIIDSPKIKAQLAIEINRIKNSPMSNAQARVATLELLRNVASMDEEQ